jgi:hypothetical protein
MFCHQATGAQPLIAGGARRHDHALVTHSMVSAVSERAMGVNTRRRATPRVFTPRDGLAACRHERQFDPDTVDTDPAVGAVARRHLGPDRRVNFHVMDDGEFLQRTASGQFDLIYAHVRGRASSPTWTRRRPCSARRPLRHRRFAAATIDLKTMRRRWRPSSTTSSGAADSRPSSWRGRPE